MVATVIAVATWLRRKRRSGSTTLGPWIGPAPVGEEEGEVGVATVTRPLVATVATGQEVATKMSTFVATGEEGEGEEVGGAGDSAG